MQQVLRKKENKLEKEKKRCGDKQILTNSNVIHILWTNHKSTNNPKSTVLSSTGEHCTSNTGKELSDREIHTVLFFGPGIYGMFTKSNPILEPKYRFRFFS